MLLEQLLDGVDLGAPAHKGGQRAGEVVEWLYWLGLWAAAIEESQCLGVLNRLCAALDTELLVDPFTIPFNCI